MKPQEWEMERLIEFVKLGKFHPQIFSAKPLPVSVSVQLCDCGTAVMVYMPP